MDKLTDIEKDFSQWYQDVVFQAELVDSTPVRGCFVLRPYSYALWENMVAVLDKKIKETGTQNAYFPLFIPEHFLKKEAEHIEGFSPEVAVVSYAGGKELEEKLVVRPTSETIIYAMFSKWIKSWRDLPLKVNQWANIIRWEMRPRPFLRTVEFLWQEGHTAHRTFDEAKVMALQARDIYKNFIEQYLAIPVISGQKSESEKFAGGFATYTLEGLMQDGKALQMCTSHILNQSFSSAFDIKFQDEDGQLKNPWCTSWGSTTRLIGGLIMSHGDKDGLIMPPAIAPIKAVIIPIYKKEEEKGAVLQKANLIKDNFIKSGLNVIIDDSDQLSPGAKFYHWELKGVPVRIEIGPKDLEKNQAVLVNRVEKDKNKKKIFVDINNIQDNLSELFSTIQAQLFARAQERLKNNWHQADYLENFGQNLENNNGLYQVGWCENPECEQKLKDYKGSIRCVVEDRKHTNCFFCKKASKTDVLVAKAY